MNQIQKIKSLKLDQWFLSQTGKPNSQASSFVASFVLNFVLRNLPYEKKDEFLDLVVEGDNPKIFEFIKANIPDFETRIQSQLGQKIDQIKSKVLKEL